jgi:1-deoxy-D-xylulose-5-phosphate reductoisomerase
LKKRIAILGSTGSIGCNALDLLKRIPKRFEVVGLTANENISLLKKQVEEWQPRVIAVGDEEKCREIRTLINLRKTSVLSGIEGILEVAIRKDVDLVLSAIVGSTGLRPTMAAIEAGKQIALASKEPVVMAGELLMAEVRKRGAALIPVDSEPNAIFQCLQGRKKESVKRLIVTASGGPFRSLSREEMSRVTPEEALAHPAWKMGKKISVDSATMINKGLEVIEAHYIFEIPVSKIDVVIHPEAKIHSMVEFIDGNILAVIGVTDMRTPIQYALTYPEKIPTPIKPLDLSQISPLTFQTPDTDRFPGLECGYSAAKAGGTMPAVLNAANEIAVAAFIEGEIGFLDITDLCRKVMEKHKTEQKPGMEEILEADRWAREETERLIRKP